GNLAPHGWTSTHTLNAYKAFADDLDAEEIFNPDPMKRCFFSSFSPGVNTRRYELQFPALGVVQFHFKYAISASWLEPNPDAEPPYQPENYPISSNQPEPFKIEFIDNGSTAYFENSSTYGGDILGLLKIHDWQFNGEISSITDEISGVMIESPILFDGVLTLNLDNAYPDPVDTLAIIAPFEIGNVTPDAVDNQFLLVTVLSANPSTYEPQIPGISDFDYPDAPLASYAIFEAPITAIGPQNIAPVADASLTNPTQGPEPLEVLFDPSASYDPDGVIVLYEWDFDGDGIYDHSSETPDIVPHTYYIEDTYYAVLRVTDDDDATDTDEIKIQVGCFSTPGWPTFRHDNRRTGRSSNLGPLTNNLKFTWSLPGGGDSPIMSGIVIDELGRALFRCNDGHIYCVDSDGDTAWSYYVGGSWDYCTPSIAKNGNVYVGNTLGQLHCFDSEGNFLWMKQYPYSTIGGGIAIQDDGSVLFTTHGGYLVKTFEDGTIDWIYSTGSTMPDGPSVNSDGIIYVANHGGQVHAVDQNGDQVWMTQVSNIQMSSTPALGAVGMFIGDWSGTVHRVNYDGTVEWSKWLSSDSISSFASVGCDGFIYIGSRDDRLYCIDQETGDVEWSYLTCGDIGTMSPVLDG
ncbi:MAG TPA: hypothetical protein ENN67_03990, partial [Firmicutes bacterium]|nr:hypothetical protein [Bacillota bacterium]